MPFSEEAKMEPGTRSIPTLIKRWIYHGAILISALAIAPEKALSVVYGEDLFWPTPNDAFIQGLPPGAYLQPTTSGRIESGNWGCSRNGGSKYHEGVDLKPIHRSKAKGTTDRIFCIADGIVAHVNRKVADSNYGRYVVVSHQEKGLEWFSLYAHLGSIDKSIIPHRKIRGGEVLGVMGNTSSSIVIPKSHSHLHLEVGVRASAFFDQWYLQQNYDSPNQHASWNGLNLIGTNPLDFYRYFLDHPGASFADYFLNEPVFFEVLLYFNRPPDFLNRNPVFCSDRQLSDRSGWFIVGLTWYGFPVAWAPVDQKRVDVRFQKDRIYVRSSKGEHACRKWVVSSNGSPSPSRLLLQHMAILKSGD